MRFRRRPPAPGEHDARALEIANRRIWQLEMDNTRLKAARERAESAHRLICPCTYELIEARFQRDEADRRTATAENAQELLHQRLRAVVSRAQRDSNATTKPIPVITPRDRL